jgi:hypothetical protein
MKMKHNIHIRKEERQSMKEVRTPTVEIKQKIMKELLNRSVLLSDLSLTPSCNGCDTIDAFCETNDMGYCRTCYKEAIAPEREERQGYYHE